MIIIYTCRITKYDDLNMTTSWWRHKIAQRHKLWIVSLIYQVTVGLECSSWAAFYLFKSDERWVLPCWGFISNFTVKLVCKLYYIKINKNHNWQENHRRSQRNIKYNITNNVIIVTTVNMGVFSSMRTKMDDTVDKTIQHFKYKFLAPAVLI